MFPREKTLLPNGAAFRNPSDSWAPSVAASSLMLTLPKTKSPCDPSLCTAYLYGSPGVKLSSAVQSMEGLGLWACYMQKQNKQKILTRLAKELLSTCLYNRQTDTHTYSHIYTTHIHNTHTHTTYSTHTHTLCIEQHSKAP